MLKSRGVKAFDGLPDFQFETIPDGLPPTAHDHHNDYETVSLLFESIPKNCLLPFQNLLARLNHSASNGLVPPVTCLVSDAFMSFTVEAAQNLGLPILLLWTASASGCLCVLHFRTTLLQRFTDESSLEREVDWIPGIKNIKASYLPRFVTTEADPNDLRLRFFEGMMKIANRASAICFNTFDELESEEMKALSSMFTCPLYTIGPFNSFLTQAPHNNSHLELTSLGSSLWKEDNECLHWLQSQKPKSVFYVNFGSTTVMSPQHLYEFAWGLANSKKTFLWIIRPDLVDGGSVILSPEFHNETKDRGFITSWCDQEKVLNHPSIGGFLTHCGWNSLIESLCAGVPMACWPFRGDQPANCSYACTVWEIGIEIDNDVKKEEVEKLVIELMEGEKGKKMREKALEWKKMADENTRPGEAESGKECVEEIVGGTWEVVEEDALDGVTHNPWNVVQSERKTS
ncbi:7-deoxyloganetin glucosyltransferase-like [Senna tora]|uniref:Glycosyltransferase n=1 Tax=Senna tora TaxID=362788 RepID=A0A834SGN0_9FABA|nr:7-deoxyloganetin glucosyltransferase-like [Senna tora]